jgi:hypothetical protein
MALKYSKDQNCRGRAGSLTQTGILSSFSLFAQKGGSKALASSNNGFEEI